MKTFRNIVLTIGLLILVNISANSQSFAGKWEGSLIVTVEGEDVYLPFKMVIITDEDGTCSGQTSLWIKIDEVLYHAIYSFKGTYNGTTLKFSDISIVESNSPSNPDFYWCSKSGTLYLNGTSITGNVIGYSPKGDCMPARASLVFHSKLSD